MRRSEPKITAAEAARMISYHPDTGEFTWLNGNGGRMAAGARAGSQAKTGYIFIRLEYRRYAAGRVAWAIMTGEWPPLEATVDHEDINPWNYRWDNLRLATFSQSCCNRRKQRNNTSGSKGVTLFRGRWRARIQVRRKEIHLGSFAAKADAVAAYARAAAYHHGEFSRR